MFLDLLEPAQHLAHLLRAVGHRVQADDCITGTEAQTFQGGGRDTLRIISGVVGLKPAAQGAGQTNGGIAVGGDGDFLGGVDQIQVAHDLAHRRHHFRCQAPAEFADVVAGCGFAQNPLPQVGHRPAPDFVVDGFVHVILNDPGDFVLFIRYRRTFPEVPQGQRRQHHLGSHPLLGVFRGKTRQLVSGFLLVGLGQHLFDVPECVSFPQQGGFQLHSVHPFVHGASGHSGHGQTVPGCSAFLRTIKI